MYSLLDVVSITLLAVAVILTGTGGTLDVLGLRKTFATREHYWNDGLFLVQFVIAINLVFRRR